LLLSNPRVVDQLPSQSPTKDQESRTSFDRIVAKDEVSQSEERVDLRNRQDETEDPTLPPLCYPIFLDQWQCMLYIVVVVHRMPIAEVPVKWSGILEGG
jgi:hypothetical protein